MKKSFVSLLTLAAISFGMVSCGGNKSQDAAQNVEEEAVIAGEVSKSLLTAELKDEVTRFLKDMPSSDLPYKLSTDEDREIIESVGDKKCIVILNKIDLESKIDEKMINSFENILKVSAKEELGLGDLKETIKELFFSGKIDAESLIISNSSHKQALFRALENAENALNRVRMNEYLDLISIFVTSSLRALNEITGDELEEDLVNKIFGDFCVGK